MAAAVVVGAKGGTLPWVEKYRPGSLDEVVAHEEILATLRKLMNGEMMPHLLFYGPPGTGKTTTIKACAYYLYGKDRVKGNVLEMNASDDRGIDTVRHQIKEFASTSSIFSSLTTRRATTAASSSSSSVIANHSVNEAATPSPPERTTGAVNFKLVILDEADQMSSDAQAALRRIVEKYTKNVRFCIVCNHINKIIPALQSRCTRFRFSPVRRKAMLPRLMEVMARENVKGTKDGAEAAYRLSCGDLRRCLNMMQAAALSFGEITEESVYRATGNPSPTDIHALVQTMLSNDFVAAWEKQMQDIVLARGMSVVDVVRELHPVLMAMDLPQECKCFALIKLGDIEYYAAAGAQEATMLGGVLGVFQLIKEAVTQKKDIDTLAKCC